MAGDPKAIEAAARAFALPIELVTLLSDLPEDEKRGVMVCMNLMLAAHGDGNLTRVAEELCEAAGGHHIRRERPSKG